MPAPIRLRAATLLTVALGLLALPARAAAQFWPEEPVRAAAESWIKMLDEGRYEEAWDAASPHFREGKGKLDWMRQQKDLAEEHGPLSDRACHSGVRAASYPPAGSDVSMNEVLCASLDAKKGGWLERVTLVREKGKDRPWMVYRYESEPRPLIKF